MRPGHGECPNRPWGGYPVRRGRRGGRGEADVLLAHEARLAVERAGARLARTARSPAAVQVIRRAAADHRGVPRRSALPRAQSRVFRRFSYVTLHMVRVSGRTSPGPRAPSTPRHQTVGQPPPKAPQTPSNDLSEYSLSGHTATISTRSAAGGDPARIAQSRWAQRRSPRGSPPSAASAISLSALRGRCERRTPRSRRRTRGRRRP